MTCRVTQLIRAGTGALLTQAHSLQACAVCCVPCAVCCALCAVCCVLWGGTQEPTHAGVPGAGQPGGPQEPFLRFHSWLWEGAESPEEMEDEEVSKWNPGGVTIKNNNIALATIY